MIPKHLKDITEADIIQLQSSGVEEGATIEYKEELPGTKDEDKREFLADVSSFANTSGGDLIYGVAENQGVIVNIVGAKSPDFDAEILRLESLVRDGTAPRISVAISTIVCSAGKLVVLRVEKSWNGPHRVTFRGHDKFYARTSAGKFPLDVSQLRSAFLRSASLAERINAFRVDRLIDVANDNAPMPLARMPTTILHIVPLGALSEQVEFDVARFVDNPLLHRPWNGSGWEPRMTFEGALLYNFTDQEGRVSGYTHFYRNGILEVATTLLLQTPFAKADLLPSASFEGELIRYLPKCFESLADMGVLPPVSVMLTLIGVEGRRMALHPLTTNRGYPIRETNLLLPGVVVEKFTALAIPILKPLFDRIWNACGMMRSMNFNDKGEWEPRQW